MANSERKQKPHQGFILNSNDEVYSTLHGVIPESGITASVTVNINQQMLIIHADDRIIDIMTIAINNRTRERNYFKLYCQLLQNEISEADFNRMIDENPNEYVPEEYHNYGPLEIALARKASENIMDVADLNDMASLFSISMGSIRKCLPANG